jgi:2-methylisocitrate lyase-like PEP mutase family enzyme
MHTTQQKKGAAFAALHRQAKAFIVANAWDAGSTRILTAAGFSAVATTSAGFAFSLGKQDNKVGREAILQNAADIVAATHLPVSADLENGFGDSAEAAAETIRMAAAVGLVGGSIEDSTYDAAQPLYEIAHAADRVRAAVEAARAQPFPFVLTARAENFLVGRPNLADAIKRLQAYQEAGADVLYAPGLTREEDIRSVVQSVDRPVNVVMGLMGSPFNVAALSAIGVKRISVGSALARRAYGALRDAAREMMEHGTFRFADQAAPYGELNGLFAAAPAASSSSG